MIESYIFESIFIPGVVVVIRQVVKHIRHISMQKRIVKMRKQPHLLLESSIHFSVDSLYSSQASFRRHTFDEVNQGLKIFVTVN